MKLIVGLGNPGRQYEKTRHNVGFMVIDELSNRLNIPLDKPKFNGIYGQGHIQGEKVILLKPLTYMNLSGESVAPLMNYYGVELDDLLVIYDDLDLPPGKIRLRQKGSPGGHNGIKSLIQHLGTQEFKRIRIGVGRPTVPMKVTDYVLGQFQQDERDDIHGAIINSVEASEAWFQKSFLEVMNGFNS